MKTITKEIIQSIFKKRESNSHKGTYGHALLIAGQTSQMGAAVIASKSCLRSGVGLLTVDIPKEERLILQTALPEAMLSFRENNISVENFSAIAIGPGIGCSSYSLALLKKTLAAHNRPLVIDADGLNLIAQNTDLFHHLPEDTILTPHPKEFDRLFGDCANEEERIAIAQKKAKELRCIIVLKGNHTHVISKDDILLNIVGNAGLAKGGSGDALTGMILSFLSQGYTPYQAAQLAVYLHGLAADLTLNRQSMESMLITDVIENLGAAFQSLDV